MEAVSETKTKRMKDFGLGRQDEKAKPRTLEAERVKLTIVAETPEASRVGPERPTSKIDLLEWPPRLRKERGRRRRPRGQLIPESCNYSAQKLCLEA